MQHSVCAEKTMPICIQQRFCFKILVLQFAFINNSGKEWCSSDGTELFKCVPVVGKISIWLCWLHLVHWVGNRCLLLVPHGVQTQPVEMQAAPKALCSHQAFCPGELAPRSDMDTMDNNPPWPD